MKSMVNTLLPIGNSVNHCINQLVQIDIMGGRLEVKGGLVFLCFTSLSFLPLDKWL